MPEIAVTAAEHRHCLQEQLARREQAACPFGKAIEVVRTEAGVAWRVEILPPREVGDELPKDSEEIPVHVDVDMRSPDVASTFQFFTNERERTVVDLHAAVEEQH